LREHKTKHGPLLHEPSFGVYQPTADTYTMSMRPSQALAQHHVAVCSAAQRYRVSNPRVFGSVLHGSDEEGSDLDLLVDPLPGATLFDLGGLQDELEQLMGLRVDVLTPKDLPAKFRDQVLAEARPL
jgi:uncharacterized protein